MTTAPRPEALVYTLPEVCDLLKLSRASVYRLRDRGLLRPMRSVRAFRVTRRELDRFLAECN